MVCSQEMIVQNIVFVIFCRKPHMGFGHVVDVMVVWIPWASVDGYIDKMKTTMIHLANGSYGNLIH